SRQPHLVRGVGFKNDPAFFQTPRFGYVIGRPYDSMFPRSWLTNVETIYDGPLKMQYDDLDPNASYRVKISYAGDDPAVKIRLMPDDKFEIHPEITKPRPPVPLEFDVPVEATRDGHLTLTWHRQKGLGGNGRGNAVAEVWLMKKSG